MNLIIEALEILPSSIKLEWIHFGDGELMEHIKDLSQKKLSKKKNIKYTFKGYKHNEYVMNYYKETHIDCFITTSSTEGMPVSIEEALSFGIPIIATDVGGIAETINDNGILLPSNPDVKQISDAIISLYNKTEEEINQMRHNSYKIWEEKFDSEKSKKTLRKLLVDGN